MDKAHEWTDAQLEKLERKITQEYLQAAREMHEKEQKALAAYRKEREQRLKAMDDTPEARREYKAWLELQAIDQARIRAMVAQLSDSAMRANERAAEMSRNFLPAIFCENANMAAFEIDKAVRADTMFTLVDESTVRYLMGLSDNEPLIHEVIDMGPAMERVQSLSKSFPRVDRARDIRWNRQHFASAIMQGILQGESVPNIVKRVDSIYGMNRAAAVRAVRTATTAAENAGRVSSYERASALGIPLVQEWMATLDMRTRPTHKEADGQQVEVGEKFIVGGSELEYPGDPAGEPSETYNCRCTLRGRVKGFENYQQENRWSRLPDNMTYEEWKRGKQTVEPTSRGTVVQGSNILGTWQRREDEFDFEIEDVLNAQGFDGLPRVVSADEFDAAVREANGGNGLIMQRTYSAPDQATLDAYREMLYEGKWYVDCSTGGAQYGQGMYAAADYSGVLSQGIKDEMQHYQDIYAKNMTEQARGLAYEYAKKQITPEMIVQETTARDYAISQRQAELYFKNQLGIMSDAERTEYKSLLKSEGKTWRYAAGNAYDKLIKKYMAEYESTVGAYVETMTLDPRARIITYDDLQELSVNVRIAITDSYHARIKELDEILDQDEISELKHIRDRAIREIQDMDEGAFAAAMGYDAINAVGHGASGSYTVILNRTMLIIKEP